MKFRLFLAIVPLMFITACAIDASTLPGDDEPMTPTAAHPVPATPDLAATVSASNPSGTPETLPSPSPMASVPPSALAAPTTSRLATPVGVQPTTAQAAQQSIREQMDTIAESMAPKAKPVADVQSNSTPIADAWGLGDFGAGVDDFGSPGLVSTTAVPMRLRRLNKTDMVMAIADPNTAQVAYKNGKLRLYEVHLAKMVELTGHICSQEGLPGMRWDYVVAGKDRGIYAIACPWANNLRQRFGTIKPELTTIATANGVWSQKVPILDIADQRVDPWIVITQTLHPVPKRRAS